MGMVQYGCSLKDRTNKSLSRGGKLAISASIGVLCYVGDWVVIFCGHVGAPELCDEVKSK